MPWFNTKEKTKLAALSASNDSVREDIERKQKELSAINHELDTCMHETSGIEHDIELAQQDKATADSETSGLRLEVSNAQVDIIKLRQKISEAVASAESASRESDAIIDHICQLGGQMKEMHVKAQAANEDAQHEIAALKQKEEAARSKLQFTKQEREELQRQSNDRLCRVSQARSDLESVKSQHAAMREALDCLQKAHAALLAEHSASEKSLGLQKEQCMKLEYEVYSLETQVQDAMVARKKLEHDNCERQATLASVRASLEEKDVLLKQKMDSCEKQFLEAKDQRDRLLAEAAQTHNALSAFLPYHFALQAQYVQSQGEAEKSGREHDSLQWEHHNLQADLQMLAERYDTGHLSATLL